MHAQQQHLRPQQRVPLDDAKRCADAILLLAWLRVEPTTRCFPADSASGQVLLDLVRAGLVSVEVEEVEDGLVLLHVIEVSR
jgi:hypothetical protein